MLATLIARHWLGGWKYRISSWSAGADWHVPIDKILPKYGISLSRYNTPQEVASVFRPRWRWRPDPAWQLGDIVLPPARLLAAGGDDCDGWAMSHAQAIATALGPIGWQARIVSYMADPWWLSHHFAVARDPLGRWWAIQPQPSFEQPDNLDPVWPVPFDTCKDAADVIAATYNSKVVFHDVRSPMWELIPG